ncbi:DUF4376 domain-containing protein [Pseudomonas sp. o96-267]|nr:DUF4376 domain-containing protein [Pseudomonas sp. o96-267]
MPSVVGLQFVWARESQYPAFTPELFGTCPDSSDTDRPGVMGVMTETEWLAARQQENADRRALTAQQIAARRWQAETGGITLNGMHIDTGRDSQALITGATVQAMLDPNYSLRWKTVAGFVDLTAGQIIGVATAARAHVQACFNREAELLDALEAGTLTPEMLEEGWPNEPLPEPTPS